MQIDDIGAATSHDFKKPPKHMIPQRHYFKSRIYKLLQITITKLLIRKV